MTWSAAAAALALAGFSVAAAARLSAGTGGWRVALALVRRRALVIASYKFRLAFMALNVVLFFAIVAFVASGFLLPALGPALEGRGGEVILYIVIGLAAWPVAWTGYRASATTVREEQQIGTLETTVGTPAGLESLPFASYVSGVLEALFWGSGTLAFMLWLLPRRADFDPSALPVALAAVVLASLFLWGVGLLMAALTTYYKELGSATSFLQYGLIVLSGAYIPLDALPGPIAAVGRGFPLTIAFEIVRGAVFGGLDTWRGVGALLWLAAAALGMVAVGSFAFARGVEASRRAGVLGGY